MKGWKRQAQNEFFTTNKQKSKNLSTTYTQFVDSFTGHAWEGFFVDIKKKKFLKEIFKINFYFEIYEKPLTLPHLSSKIKYAIFLKNGAVRVPVIEK